MRGEIDMDIGRMLIFIPAMIYFVYLFLKRKKDFFLLCGIASWLGLSYGGKHGLYYILEQPINGYIDSISKLLLAIVFILYFIKSFKEIR